MATCRQCDYYDREHNICGKWQGPAQMPQKACGDFKYKDPVIAVKTIKEHKFITF